jgi:hypothetical protein
MTQKSLKNSQKKKKKSPQKKKSIDYLFFGGRGNFEPDRFLYRFFWVCWIFVCFFFSYELGTGIIIFLDIGGWLIFDDGK